LWPLLIKAQVIWGSWETAPCKVRRRLLPLVVLVRLPFFGPFAIADMAGLDVYEFCYRSLQTRFPDRFATPQILTELVAQGRLGTKSGGGFRVCPPSGSRS